MSLVQVVEFSPEGKKLTARIMYIDAGTALTGIYDLRPDARTVLKQNPGQVEPLSTVAYAGKTNPKILIIGSGGGDEVLAGLQAGASSITAIEINPIISDIVAKRMKDRKSTRLNSSHGYISYAVFCLKKEIHAYSFSRYCDRFEHASS